MRPTKFPESNSTLLAPPGMNDCEDLPVWKDGHDVVSLWRPTLRERFSLLLFGRLWIHFVGATTHPPVGLTIKNRYFRKECER